MATRRIYRTRPPQYDRFNPPEPYYPQYTPPPAPRGAGLIDWLLLLFCVVIGSAILSSWLGIDPRQFIGAPAAPTVHAVAPPSAPAPSVPQSQPAPQPAPIVEQAPAQPAVAPPAVPTAAVIVPPQAAPVVVVPHAAPRIAPESAPAPEAPTIATTAPMVVGKDFQAPSKTCVETERKGETVHFEQVQDLTPAEMSSVADYLRTGMIEGKAGPCAAH